MFRKKCIVLGEEDTLSNPHCLENIYWSKQSFEFEKNTLYILNFVRSTVNLIEKIISENPCRNIVFKTKSSFVKFIIGKNPLEELTNIDNIIAVYLFSNETNIFEKISIDLDIDDYVYLLISKLPKPLVKLTNKVLRFVKFTVVGFTGFLVNLLVLYLATSIYLKIASYEYAVMYGSVTSFEISLTWNFILHEYWTFRDRVYKRNLTKLLERWLKFHASSLGSFLSQLFFVTILSGYFKQPLFLSLTIGVVVGLTINYVLSSRIIWRK